ncbi:MAG TPA: ATP-binding protein [Spirochaetota bacterium]|nr:ATP-binding protein [Spirochaetota bacterium]HPC40824.1 ATP-binding protein [Spirochaetota bacterium]HPL18373.1 ATP-binding protein [Spirochaetota bacterium]HQF07786.1 ATP-binding protein [Spirochaetota bacterium]HQH96839.1 ATP-binding protein [Spirochaetota bacterium]
MSNRNLDIDFLNSYSANTAVIPEVIERLIGDLRKVRYTQDDIDEIVLSMDEAITNAVQETMKTNQNLHRRVEADDDRRDITVRYTISKDIFDATIIDHGKGLDIFNILHSTPQTGTTTYMNQIISYATESEKSKIKVRLNGREIPLRGIGAGLKVILHFMDAITIDLIDKEKILSQSVSEHTDGTIFNMKRKRRYK